MCSENIIFMLNNWTCSWCICFLIKKMCYFEITENPSFLLFICLNSLPSFHPFKPFTFNFIIAMHDISLKKWIHCYSSEVFIGISVTQSFKRSQRLKGPLYLRWKKSEWYLTCGSYLQWYESTSGILCLVLGPSVWEGQGTAWESPAQSHKDD